MISTPFTSFVGENGPEYGYISIDVTSAVQDILTAGAQFIGFRLSTETDDRFELGRCIGVPEPVLTVVPEPASVLLLALGGLALIRRRQQAVSRTLLLLTVEYILAYRQQWNTNSGYLSGQI